jgi:hypothetical protein
VNTEIHPKEKCFTQ